MKPGPRHTTVPSTKPPRLPRRARSPRARTASRGRRLRAEIFAQPEASLLDVVDNLLGKGVVVNADLVLALANVDLVCVRLSALLCAADRLLPPRSE